MKETVVGRIVLGEDGTRVLQPISNVQHAQRVIDHQLAQRLFMEAASAFMVDPSTKNFKALTVRFATLNRSD